MAEGFRASASVRSAAQVGDYGRVIRLVREAGRIPQAQLAQACGLTQSSISRLERRGVGGYDMEQLARAAAHLHIPPGLVGLADDVHEGVERRTFVAGVTSLAASVTLAGVVDSEETDARAANIRVVTSAYRRLDGSVSARQLIEPVRTHLRMVQELAQTSTGADVRRRLAAAGSELASFAAWLSWDMADHGSARVWYGAAMTTARRAGDPLLWAYQAGSLAQLEIDRGNDAQALALIHGARARVGPERPAISEAWLSSLEAQAHAAAGNEGETLRALDDCETAASRVPGEHAPPWPWVFHFGAEKVAAARVACGVHLGRPAWVFEALPRTTAASGAGHAKQRALLMLDVAHAHLAEGRTDAAFMLANPAVDTGIEHRSGRVIERARGLRRAVRTRGLPRSVREFDERLHGVHL